MKQRKFAILLLLFLFICAIFVVLFILKTKNIFVSFPTTRRTVEKQIVSSKGEVIRDFISTISKQNLEQSTPFLGSNYIKTKGEVPLKDNLSQLKGATVSFIEPFSMSPWTKTKELYRAQIQIPNVTSGSSLATSSGLMNWKKGQNDIVVIVVNENNMWKIDGIVEFR